jgi:NAD(P)-dependent dehydrogenase (short-subunit alcohol dehydrogenase family)
MRIRPVIALRPDVHQREAGQNRPLDPHVIAETVVPLGRAGDASQIADGIRFLASEMSSHISGSELTIDGGMTAGRTTRLNPP